MTYQELIRQQNRLINYIRRQPEVIDYVAYSPMDASLGHCVSRGVLVACDMATLHRLEAHAKRYYPDMSIIPMTVAQCISHMNRPRRNNHDSI